MSDNPVLSIITVCYNEKEVERTCKSITEQTFKDFEWIVIDGGSNAETLKILEKYKFKMDFFVSEKDTGIYNAMNKGIAQAKGIWLNFMNAGDAFFENTSLEKLFFKNANSFKKNDVVYCNSLSHKDNGKTYTTSFYKKLDYPFWCENCISHQASFIKKELFEKFGPYSEEYKISGDLDKWLLFLSKGCKFKHLKNVVANYYENGISARNTELREKERKTILDKYFINSYKTAETIRFLGIPIIRIKKSRDNKKYKIVFLKIPVFVGKTNL